MYIRSNNMSQRYSVTHRYGNTVTLTPNDHQCYTPSPFKGGCKTVTVINATVKQFIQRYGYNPISSHNIKDASAAQYVLLERV